ncbi:MAG: hypothetical protein LBQ50_10515, partial [Planctomycetaceae bacterium]|nr:hypothetical protein [Planctomycetaceae bacterium]
STPIFDALDEIILEMLFANIDNNTKIQFVIDDTTTKRYGILIEGAGHHHYPTPGKTDTKLCYGHSWVVAAIVVTHHEWGTADCKKEDKNDYCNKQDNTGKIGQVGVD